MSVWNNISYQKIKNVKPDNDILVISFQNGDVVKVYQKNLIPFGFTDIMWSELTFNPYEIIIPASPNSLEIPWDKIRVVTDKEFAKHLAELSKEQSKLIGVKLKRLRERKGIASNELAERAKVTPQTISRIEQGHTDVSFTTLRQILASMGYSLKDLANQEIELELENSQKSFSELIKKLRYVGIDSNLLTKKIIPTRLQVALNSHTSTQTSLLLDEAVNYVSTIYGWNPNDIWTNQNLVIKSNPAAMGFFKKPTNANEVQVKAYSHYAYYLAKIVLKAIPLKDTKKYPDSMEEFKKQYLKKFKEISLTSLLEFIWDLGISVLPLDDSGVFHGASWNIEGRHIVILKQHTESHARWIFDLLHEVYHVFAHLSDDNTSVIEVEELNPFASNESTEELEANTFANQIIFGKRAEDLAQQCVVEAKADIRNLSKAVKQVAKKEKVGTDFLSNYLAFRLSNQGENWWGSANRMQMTDPSPFILVSDFLKSKMQTQKLNPIDYNLLATAITK